MANEAKTCVANPGESLNSKEVEQSYVRECELAKERDCLRKFGLIGFDAYREWVLNNQLPLS